MVLIGQKWLYLGKSGSIRANVVVFEKVVVIRHKWLFSGKVVVFVQKMLYSSKVVEFGQKWMYSGKNGVIRAKVVVFVQSGCI